jgi:hypothetical protein
MRLCAQTGDKWRLYPPNRHKSVYLAPSLTGVRAIVAFIAATPPPLAWTVAFVSTDSRVYRGAPGLAVEARC